MNDEVALSIRQMDGAWRLMCAGGPTPVVAATEGIQYIVSGIPVSFFNLAMLTDAGLSAEALSARGHRVEWLPELSIGTAGVCAISGDLGRGILYGGADPRRAARAMGW